MNFAAIGMAWLAVLGAVVPAIYLYMNRTQPGAKCMFALCVVLAIYPLDVLFLSGLAAVQHSFSSVSLVAPLYLLSVLSSLRVPIVRRPLFILSMCVYMVVAALAPWLPGTWYLDYAVNQPYQDVHHYLYVAGVGAWSMKILSYLFIGVAAAVVIHRFSSSHSPRPYVLALAFFPILAGLVDLIAALADYSPHYGISTVQITTTIGLFALSFALLRRQILERVPVSRKVLMSHMREGMCVIGDNGEIIDCNEAMGVIIGRSGNQLMGCSASRVLPESLLEQLEVQRRKGDVNDVEVRLENGARVVSVSASRLDVESGGPATLLSVTDITQRSQHLQSVQAVAGELRAANEQLAVLSTTDELTGLGNRRLMHEELAARLRDDDAGSTGLLMVDIDHFKAINDTHGHPAGDAVLVRLAQAMRETCRDNDLIVRWGGEEFVALLGGSDERRLQLAAERLRLHIRRLVIELDNGVALQVTVSIGATLVRSGQSPESALRQVDRLLYEAKAEGRDRVKSSRPEES